MARVSGSKTQTGSDSGVAPLDVVLTPDFTELQLTITGLAVGTMTVTAKAQGGDVNEADLGGSLDLTMARTLKLSGVQLESINLSVAPAAAYSFRVEQF